MSRNEIRRTISLSFSATAVLDLETREVGVRLDLLDEWHLYEDSMSYGSGCHPNSQSGIHLVLCHFQRCLQDIHDKRFPG